MTGNQNNFKSKKMGSNTISKATMPIMRTMRIGTILFYTAAARKHWKRTRHSGKCSYMNLSPI